MRKTGLSLGCNNKLQDIVAGKLHMNNAQFHNHNYQFTSLLDHLQPVNSHLLVVSRPRRSSSPAPSMPTLRDGACEISTKKALITRRFPQGAKAHTQNSLTATRRQRCNRDGCRRLGMCF